MDTFWKLNTYSIIMSWCIPFFAVVSGLAYKGDKNDVEIGVGRNSYLTHALSVLPATAYLYCVYASCHFTWLIIMKTCPCNIQRIFSVVKIEVFVGKFLIFLIFLLKT